MATGLKKLQGDWKKLQGDWKAIEEIGKMEKCTWEIDKKDKKDKKDPIQEWIDAWYKLGKV